MRQVFLHANPDVNAQHGQQAGDYGTVISVKAASTNLVPSQEQQLLFQMEQEVDSTVTITGVSSTIPSGFGFLVETTTTDHTYAFHRLVPKATEVTTVAGKAV
ncbi:MAG: hypothetical protein CM15mV139_290 [Caudoviricetes sp.]|nr:MAG: hypothetical protein CM15mV139_290 [Caudoviricetes sp.]